MLKRQTRWYRGCRAVGMAAAYAIVQQRVVRQLVLIDRRLFHRLFLDAVYAEKQPLDLT